MSALGSGLSALAAEGWSREPARAQSPKPKAGMIAVRAYAPSRARADAPRRPGRAARRGQHPADQGARAHEAHTVAGELRRRRPARRLDAGDPAESARAASRR